MYFSDRDIKESIKSGEIVCEPYVEANVSVASIDLRLGEKLILVEARDQLHGAEFNETAEVPTLSEAGWGWIASEGGIAPLTGCEA